MSSSSETQQFEEVAQRPSTGAEILAWLRSPPLVERRAEHILEMGRAIGVDEARSLIERLRRKEDAIYTLFENDLILPAARPFLDQFLGMWIASTIDWGELTTKHAAELGVSVEEMMAPPLHHQRAREHNDPEDAELIPPENRYGSHLLDMEDLGGMDGNDELTNSYFQYDRYRLLPTDEDDDE